ncbi:MAG: FGGY family carbohydrate kinase [Rhodoglobus sp.]
MRTDVVVGLDFGSSRIKAAAYDRDGALVAASSAETPLVAREGGDDFLVLEMLDAAARAIAELECAPGAIAGIGLSSMGEVGTILTDDGLADLAFPSWYDKRGAEIVAALEHEYGTTELLIATGNHTRVASTVAKLGHLATTRELPAGTFLGLCGALAWQLTGRAWQEAGIAVTSGVYSRDGYLQHLWNSAGLSHVALPPVLAPGHAERASTALAVKLGLAAGAPVVIAGHDHPVAAVGAGVRPGELGDSMGTGEALIAVMQPELAADPAARAAALQSNRYLSFEVWPPTGELLVVWERMRPGLAMRSFIEHGGVDRALMDAEAPDLTTGDVFDEQTLLAMENGEPSGLAASPQTWSELIDYYVRLANYGQELVRAATGADGATVLTGGGLRSSRWRRAKAIRGRAPMVVSTVEETGTRGCAAMAGVAAGWWRSAEAMPGGERIPIGDDAVADMERAVARIAP